MRRKARKEGGVNAMHRNFVLVRGLHIEGNITSSLEPR